MPAILHTCGWACAAATPEGRRCVVAPAAVGAWAALGSPAIPRSSLHTDRCQTVSGCLTRCATAARGSQGSPEAARGAPAHSLAPTEHTIVWQSSAGSPSACQWHPTDRCRRRPGAAACPPAPSPQAVRQALSQAGIMQVQDDTVAQAEALEFDALFSTRKPRDVKVRRQGGRG